MTNLNERPSASQIFGKRAAFYTTSPAHQIPHELERLVAAAQPQPGWVALDVATGTGHTAFAVAQHVAHITAIDFTPQMLNEAHKLQTDRNIPNITFQLADVHQLPFDDASFDLVTSRRAPHHFTDINRAIREMTRVLRLGGRIVIDDRSIPEDDFVDACMNELDTLHDRSHVRQYRPSEWEGMLGAVGLTIEQVLPYHRQRPLSSLTQNADKGDIVRMTSIVASLDENQRRAMNVEHRDGEWHLNHWFVLISATKQV